MIGLAEVDDQKKNLLITKHNIICCRDGDKHVCCYTHGDLVESDSNLFKYNAADLNDCLCLN